MIKELDLVVLTRDVPEGGLKAGDVGTVVFVHDEEAFEVEFVSAAGETLAVLTLKAAELRPMDGAEILHVRGLASL
jgi:hypothetical protein